ncbi:MAG: L-2-amino-thiazoline-4-carboxylic acid hydrolase [Lachnospiraceae bacterium]|nr:L-2-amino-thiazoline-4-carboxylic acid hydrolase [Lachnospiraceae bacterium]
MAEYNALHHALLYSYVVKAVMDEVGKEAGEMTVEKATRNYGISRGRRMALRCDADDFRHDVMGYGVYGEWRQTGGRPSKGERHFDAEIPYMTSFECPWYDAWAEEGHMEYGKYYCRYVDEALGEGFFAERPMRLVTKSIRSNGGGICLFTFTGGTYTKKDLEEAAAQAEKIGTKALRGWEFHMGHLYFELAKQIREDWPDQAESILGSALAALDARFGSGFSSMLKENAAQDFATV